ncbi:Uncharacterised protein [Mycolicibacterium fortuitum]|uniref:Uncharacterized protein n=1 Tax=Mycolicibacterium fortuitum TaxID=1766 RepID=A0A378U5Z5_MYCFO|nr:Uncharacterised protein [Mycolicibacterium fortuitum]
MHAAEGVLEHRVPGVVVRAHQGEARRHLHHVRRELLRYRLKARGVLEQLLGVTDLVGDRLLETDSRSQQEVVAEDLAAGCRFVESRLQGSEGIPARRETHGVGVNVVLHPGSDGGDPRGGGHHPRGDDNDAGCGEPVTVYFLLCTHSGVGLSNEMHGISFHICK